MNNKLFNIRVYGILINKKNEILLSDECRNNTFFTKFPGGGLEWGEGIKDCLMREFKEELSIDITIDELFYCTDFFIASAFNSQQQLISIYYKVSLKHIEELTFESYKIPFYTDKEKFRWMSLSDLTEDMLTFPIDKIVVNKLIDYNKIDKTKI